MSTTVVRTTYFSALSHGKVNPDPDADVFGVVREPFDWIDDVVDRNIPALAPPADLLGAYKKVEAAAEDREDGNPREIAWNSVDFEDRYLTYLERPDVEQPLSSVRERAEDHPLWLVCYEADERWCHRRLLAERLLSDLSAPCHPNDHRIVSVPEAKHGRTCARCGFATQSLTDWFDQDISESVR